MKPLVRRTRTLNECTKVLVRNNKLLQVQYFKICVKTKSSENTNDKDKQGNKLKLQTSLFSYGLVLLFLSSLVCLSKTLLALYASIINSP